MFDNNNNNNSSNKTNNSNKTNDMNCGCCMFLQVVDMMLSEQPDHSFTDAFDPLSEMG